MRSIYKTTCRAFSSSEWMSARLAQLANSQKTAAIVVHQSEIKSGELDGKVLPTGLSASKAFRQDLNMGNAYWFYNSYGGNPAQRVLLLQKKNDKSDAKPEQIRKSFRDLGVTTCAQLQGRKASDVEILVSSKIEDSELLGIFENSVRLSNYENTFKKQPEEEEKKEKKEDEEVDSDDEDPRVKLVKKAIKNIEVVTEDGKLQQGEAYSFQLANQRATELARNLGQTRGSIATPAWMEEKMLDVIKGHEDKVTHEVVDVEKLKELGMDLFYNVGKGAVVPPRAVIVNYKGNPDSNEVEYAFIGKGLTYDTGGLNLKPTGYMEDMHGDKGGSVAVIGALQGTLELGIKKNIVFACGFAENAIGSKSYKPGDIIKGMNGLHVEVGNTDAEGRLVLADTFTYVQKNYKPKTVIDLATLTGACKVALGHMTGGMFSNDDDLIEKLKKASASSFEPMWHLPILEDHREAIKGQWADISNTGKTRGYGGASTAAAFLENFVEKDTKWAHLDIAGPAILAAPKPPMCDDCTGFGASLLLHLAANDE